MKVRFEPFGVTTLAEAGATLLQAAQAAGVDIESVCGGRGTCGKCKVIASHGLGEMTKLELRSLRPEEIAKGYRLACQAVIVGDVEVVVPDESRRSRVSILADGVQATLLHDPWVTRVVCQVPEATLENQASDQARLNRIYSALRARPLAARLHALQRLPGALRAAGGQVTLIEVDQQVIDIYPGAGPDKLLGMAFDIGTTTVVGYLLDLETGEQLAVASMMNPQTRYGDDVVSRIEFSTQDAGLGILQDEILGAINHIIAETTTKAHVSIQNIYGVTLVGNTTMQHLMAGISPAALAYAPYVPALTDALCLNAPELGVQAHDGAHVWLLPNIAGWVGADTVGVIMATGLHHHEGIALAIDIGTNGEMALGSRERLLTCSTAAGPAFEGAHLSCGMRAADGAIDTVHFDEGRIVWHAIGDSAPRGICGSGLVDLVAEMLRAGIVNEMGMMITADEWRAERGTSPLADRLLQEGRQRRFELVTADEGAGGRAICMTQRDVRELQLAKGAIRAGIEILLRELHIGADDVTVVYLAGAFGNYIKPASALTIGLMPHFPNAQTIPVGNAAGSGAKMALLSTTAREEAVDILAHTEYLELSGRPDFQECFAEAMAFGTE